MRSMAKTIECRKWPNNLVYQITGEEIINLPSDIESTISLVLYTLSERSMSILLRRFRDYERLTDIGDAYGITDCRVSAIMDEAITNIHCKYSDVIRLGINEFAVQRSLGISSYGDINNFLNKITMTDPISKLPLSCAAYTRISVVCPNREVGDIVKLYKTKLPGGKNKLMDVRKIGVKLYNEITSTLKLFGLISGKIDKWRDKDD